MQKIVSKLLTIRRPCGILFIFADFVVRRQIEGSLGDMDAFAERISPVLEHLHHQKAAIAEERGAVETAMRKLIG
jgi:hypothetical protein